MKNQKASPRAVPAPHQKEEEKPAYLKRRPWYIALLITGVLLLGVSAALAILGTFDDLERQIFNFINHADLPAWVTNQVAKPVSNAMWGMCFLVLALLLVPKYRRLAWQYVVAAGATYTFELAVEYLVNRPRPAGLESYEPVMRVTQEGLGYPSTHVGIVAALFLTIWPFVSWPWRILMVLFLVAEAWSRMFLGVHAPLDIVGGLAAAMIVVAVLHLLPAKIRRFFRLSA